MVFAQRSTLALGRLPEVARGQVLPQFGGAFLPVLTDCLGLAAQTLGRPARLFGAPAGLVRAKLLLLQLLLGGGILRNPGR